MLDTIAKLLGINQPQPDVGPINTAAQFQLPDNLAVVAAANGNDANASGGQLDWVDSANKTLAGMLKSSNVKRETADGKGEVVAMPAIASVQLGGVENKNGFSFEDAHERVQLKLRFHEHAGNYMRDSISDAIHEKLAMIPSLRGHIRPQKNADDTKETHGSVGMKLLAYLQSTGKFTKEELGYISQHFENFAGRSAEWNEREAIKVDHTGGRVQMRFYTNEVNGDQEVGRSGDQRVLDYLGKRQDTILKLMREELEKVGGMKKEELEGLSYNMMIGKCEGDENDGPVIIFGKRDVKVHGGDQGSDQLAVSELSTLDTDKVQQAFVKALLKSNDDPALPGCKIPDIFGRIADCAMIKQLIVDRLGGETPELKPLLDYPMFMDRKAYDEKMKSDVRNNVIEVPNAKEGEDSHEMNMLITLPNGVSLSSLRRELASMGNQLVLDAKRQYEAQYGRAA